VEPKRQCQAPRFPIQDRESKFTTYFDQVFASEGLEIRRTPLSAPKANAVAERWIRPAREACLDRLIVLDQRHLQYVLAEYIDYYQRARPHQATEQRTPIR
jgi:hypothetical protein